MSDLQTCAVPDSFVKNKVGRQNQIPAKDIAKVGLFPVVDQGQKFIAGYCDDESRVIDFDLPLIIFGDHTRCFKYVDFPFVLGTDGAKVLLPVRGKAMAMRRRIPIIWGLASCSSDSPAT